MKQKNPIDHSKYESGGYLLLELPFCPHLDFEIGNSLLIGIVDHRIEQGSGDVFTRL